MPTVISLQNKYTKKHSIPGENIEFYHRISFKTNILCNSIGMDTRLSQCNVHCTDNNEVMDIFTSRHPDNVFANSIAPKKEAALGTSSVAQTTTATSASMMNTAQGNSIVAQTRTANVSLMSNARGNSSVAQTSTARRKVVRC